MFLLGNGRKLEQQRTICLGRYVGVNIVDLINWSSNYIKKILCNFLHLVSYLSNLCGWTLTLRRHLYGS